ncbi:hypothetical protein CLOM_g24558 [Closterium sp. NIES-68]|nr:hypothetical protein CLOM_g24558 [Closterium sp. NIES-68]GJP66374.1 hypothetical protein CLOP_g23307 [Closterium sp. NIES-67]GJP70968.1 hypothetical protein CLOP_g1861 [Closterium sp. NIES-67]
MAPNLKTQRNLRHALPSTSRRRRSHVLSALPVLAAALFLPAFALAARPEFATERTGNADDSVVIARYQAGLSKLCLGASRDKARAVIANADYAGSDANVVLGYSQATNATFMYIGGSRIKGPRRCVPPGLLDVYTYYPSTDKFVKGDLRSLPERVVDSSYVVSLTVPSALQGTPQVNLDVSNMYPTVLEVDATQTVSAPPMSQANFTLSGSDLSSPSDPYGMVSSYLEKFGAKADTNDLSGAILVTYDPYIESHVVVYMIYRPVYSPAAVVQQYCNANAPCYFAYEMVGRYSAPQSVFARRRRLLVTSTSSDTISAYGTCVRYVWKPVCQCYRTVPC